jgi:hypothetical protein
MPQAHGDGTELQPIGSLPLPMGRAPDGSVFAFVRDRFRIPLPSAWASHAFPVAGVR